MLKYSICMLEFHYEKVIRQVTFECFTFTQKMKKVNQCLAEQFNGMKWGSMNNMGKAIFQSLKQLFFNEDLAYVTSGYFASFHQKLINSLHKESVLKIIYFRSSFIIILQWNQF